VLEFLFAEEQEEEAETEFYQSMLAGIMK